MVNLFMILLNCRTLTFIAISIILCSCNNSEKNKIQYENITIFKYLRMDERKELSGLQIVPIVALKNSKMKKLEIQLLKDNYYLFNKDLIDSTMLSSTLKTEYHSIKDSIVVYISLTELDNFSIDRYFNLFKLLSKYNFNKICFGPAPPWPKAKPVID